MKATVVVVVVRGQAESAQARFSRLFAVGRLESDASDHVGLFGQRLGIQTLRATQTPARTAMSQAESAPPPPQDARAANRTRFELELEFVQSLANPFYLHSLAQQGILKQPAFINFLAYLQYWKEKDYARFIL